MSQPRIDLAAGQLIAKIRERFPFEMPESELCDGICVGCPKKLLAYIEMELDDLERRINRPGQISLGDLSRLGRQAGKIERVLQKNQLVS